MKEALFKMQNQKGFVYQFVFVVFGIVALYLGHLFGLVLQKFIHRLGYGRLRSLQKTSAGNDSDDDDDKLQKQYRIGLLFLIGGQIVYFVVLALSVVLILKIIGIKRSAIIAAVGAGSIAVGFAFQGILNDVAAGIVLTLSNAYSVGDLVELKGTMGRVIAFDLLYTTLQDYYDLNIIKVPNRVVQTSVVINHSRIPVRSAGFNLMISNRNNVNDMDLVLKIIQEAVLQHPKVLQEPPLDISVRRMDKSGTGITVLPYVKTEDWPDAVYQIQTLVRTALQKNNILLGQRE
jgi:small conductance mechanosensitive channel